MKVLVGVSNRHVHLTKEDVNILFGENYELTVRNDLRQPGQFACNETVTLKNKDNIIERVRVIGPVRSYTQVELSKTDSNILEVNPPVRNSGDLDNSEAMTIIGPKGEITRKNCCIIANRHIHTNNSINLENNKVVSVLFNNQVIDNVVIKKSDDYELEMHVDRDDALLFGLSTGDYVDLETGD